MINTILNVDDICQDCPYFSTETDHLTNYDGIHMIYISCEHRDLCNRIRKHIEKEMNKNDYIKEIRMRAIDDFVNACKSNTLCQTFGLRQCDIEEIAEKLKEGGKNE